MSCGLAVIRLVKGKQKRKTPAPEVLGSPTTGQISNGLCLRPP